MVSLGFERWVLLSIILESVENLCMEFLVSRES